MYFQTDNSHNKNLQLSAISSYTISTPLREYKDTPPNIKYQTKMYDNGLNVSRESIIHSPSLTLLGSENVRTTDIDIHW